MKPTLIRADNFSTNFHSSTWNRDDFPILWGNSLL